MKILGEEGVIEERTKREKTAERYCNRGLRGKTERKRDNQGFRLEQLKQCFLSLYSNSLFGPTITIKWQETWARNSRNLEKPPPLLSQTNRYFSVKTHFLSIFSLFSIHPLLFSLPVYFLLTILTFFFAPTQPAWIPSASLYPVILPFTIPVTASQTSYVATYEFFKCLPSYVSMLSLSYFRTRQRV